MQYKFIIQHKKTKKGKEKINKNLKGVGATGLKYHARHRPLEELPYQWYMWNYLTCGPFASKAAF